MGERDEVCRHGAPRTVRAVAWCAAARGGCSIRRPVRVVMRCSSWLRLPGVPGAVRALRVRARHAVARGARTRGLSMPLVGSWTECFAPVPRRSPRTRRRGAWGPYGAEQRGGTRRVARRRAGPGSYRHGGAPRADPCGRSRGRRAPPRAGPAAPGTARSRHPARRPGAPCGWNLAPPPHALRATRSRRPPHARPPHARRPVLPAWGGDGATRSLRHGAPPPLRPHADHAPPRPTPVPQPRRPPPPTRPAPYLRPSPALRPRGIAPAAP